MPGVHSAPPPILAEEARKRLTASFPGVRGGRGSSRTILGPAGTGKSRLISDLGETAREQGWTVLSATGTPARAEVPRGIVLEALRPVLPGLVSPVGGERPEPGEGPPSVGLPLALAAFLPAPPEPAQRTWRTEPVSEVTPWELPASLPPAEGDALLLRRLWEAARRAPVLLELDDLHWVDPLSLGFLSTLCLSLSEHRVLLILSLEPDPAPQLVRRFAAREAGGLVEEVITLAPRSSSKPRPLPPPVPPAPEEVEPSLLETLLSYGAVIGIDFDVPTLVETTGRGELAVADGLEEGTRRGWLWRSGEKEFHFSGERTWRWALGLPYLPLAKRHAHVAAALERLHPHPEGRVLFALALHWQEAGEPQRALPYMISAAESAYGAGALETARDWLQKAHGVLSVLPPTERGGQEVRVLVDLAEVFDSLGQGGAARTRLQEALAVAEKRERAARDAAPVRETVRIEVLLADLQRRWGRADLALEILERARERAAKGRDPVAEATVLARVAMVQRRQARWKEARENVTRALELLGDRGGPAERGLVHWGAADTLVWGGPEDTAAAEESLRKARQAFEEMGQGSREVPLMNLEGLRASQLGDPETAMRLWDRATKLALQMGSLVNGANMLANQAEVLGEAGRAEEAWSAIRGVEQLLDGIDEPRVFGQVWLARATIHWRVGDIPQAEKDLDQGIALLASDASKDLRQQLEFLRARIRLSQGKIGEALELTRGLDPVRYPHLLPPGQRKEWEEIHSGAPGRA
jgi:tetratricopeptide (TPR) repeat protein